MRADDGRLEVARSGVQSLGAGHNRADIAGTCGRGLDPDHLRHVRFLVYGPHAGEPLAQRGR